MELNNMHTPFVVLKVKVEDKGGNGYFFEINISPQNFNYQFKTLEDAKNCIKDLKVQNKNFQFIIVKKTVDMREKKLIYIE